MFQFVKSLLGGTESRPQPVRLNLNFLEGRTTPAVFGSPNLTAVRHAEVEVRGRETEARHGADDAPNHERVGDNRGGMRAATAVLISRSGADDPANHNPGDDKGGRGHDDPTGHR